MTNVLDAMARGAPPWRHLLIRQGRCEETPGGLRLIVENATARGWAYSNAQIDDYQPGPGPRFIRRPPLRLRVQTRFSHPEGGLRGTAGFGFWNYPIAWPWRPPRAIWFFYASPPNDMPLALGAPGQGWKAAVIDATRPRALALLPLAPVLAVLFNLPPLYRGLYPPVQRAFGVAEALARAPMEEWHEYVIEWGARVSRFFVDGRVVLSDAPSPRGPLCFVTWVDNQYLIATPRGWIRWGLLEAPGAQWLELAGVWLETL